MKKIVGFAGSPRVGGNSDLLLDEALRGAQEAGAAVEKVYLNDLNIKACQACEACRVEGSQGCVIDDDMQALYDKLMAADTWLLATPIYWWGPSAQLKLMVDRWYGMMKEHRAALSSKKTALIAAMADDDLKTAQPTADMFNDAFAYLKMEFLPPLIVTAGAKGEVAGSSDDLAKAYQLGRDCTK